jgi:hypothetical protein
MSKKKIILTQKQLDEMVDGNVDYLSDKNDDFTFDGTNAVYTGSKMDDTDAEPLTTDKFAKQLSLQYGPWTPDGRGGSKGCIDRTNHMITCSKKEWAKKNLVNEINSDLANRKYGKDGKSHNTMSVEKARFHSAQTKSKDTDPTVRQQGLTTMQNMLKNNPELQQDVAQYNNAMAVDKNLKNSAKDRGEENVFQKKGGTKNSGNGKAHTTKSGAIITYEQ